MEKKNYGLSGFLAPDGIFYECGYKEHSQLAAELVKKYKIRFFDGDSNRVPDFIKFGCSPFAGPDGDGSCHAFMWEKPTSEQVKFIIDNLDRMTGKQRRIVLGDLDVFEISI